MVLALSPWVLALLVVTTTAGDPTEIPMSGERLRLAITGLGGIAGALVLPTLSTWLRLLLAFIEPDHSGLGGQQRVSWFAILRALALTLLLGFIVMNWQQAASELQQVQAEAPIASATLTGFIVGAILWTAYALGLRVLMSEWQHARTSRRIGGFLR